jgi:hypothetical protein
MKKLILLIVHGFIVLSTYAQYYDWTIYDTVNSPLQTNEVMCLAVDHDSSIWIGAGNIVYKLDNGNWTIYDTITIGHNCWRIQQITVDSDNNKWFATLNGMLKYDNSTWTVYTTSNSGIPEDYIWSIAADHDNKIWFYSPDGPGGGFCNYDGSNWNIYNADSADLLFLAGANRIAVDDDNNKWFAGAGLYKYDNTEWTHQVIYIDFNEQIGEVSSVDFNTNGDRWLSYDQYITVYTNSGNITYDDENTGFPIYHTNRVAFDSSGYIWAGGGAGKLARFNGTEWNQYNPVNSPMPTNGGIAGAQISDIVIGRGGEIYVSTFQGGLVVLEENTSGVDCSDTNYIPTVTASAPLTICSDDSITLQAQQGYNTYLWSTGETTNSIIVSDSSEYFVSVLVDACWFVSDTLEINVRTVEVPVSENGELLISDSTFVSYQWYLNSEPIPTATNQTYCAMQNGSYYVEVVDEFGCIATSVIIEHSYDNPFCGIGINEPENNFNIYPNPVTTELTVIGYNPAALKLCNAVGQTVAQSKSNKLYVGNLSQGLYVLQLFDSNGQQVKTEKVIVAK